MNRRDLLAATVGTTALVGCLDSGPQDDGDGDGAAEPDSTEPPFEIATIDAPGSEAGTVTVPDANAPMVCNFTRTQCPTSRGFLATLAEARSRLETEGRAVDGADPDVRFLSVTDGTVGPSPTDDELTTWFEENEGNWSLGRDESGACYEYYDIEGYPTTIVVDSTETVHWRNRGRSSPADVVRGVSDAIEAETDSGGNESTANRTDG